MLVSGAAFFGEGCIFTSFAPAALDTPTDKTNIADTNVVVIFLYTLVPLIKFLILIANQPDFGD